MVIADFQVENKGGRPRFFQETFLVGDTKFEVVLGMPFLKISNASIAFNKKTLMWRLYTTNQALSTPKQVQMVDLKEFIIAALDMDSKTFVVYLTIRKREDMAMDLATKAQIEAQSGAQT